MNELALFAGAGGGILGGKLLGWRTVCAVEWESYPASVLLARQNDGFLPPFPIWDDVRTFDGKPWRGIVDVISGGFPCQDISIAGKGDGLDGERSGMWREMARIIGEVRPKFVFVENSPMLVVRGLDRVLADLTQMGYDTQWGIMGAADVGAPHKRDRIWIVGLSNTYSKSDAIRRCDRSVSQISRCGSSNTSRSRRNVGSVTQSTKNEQMDTKNVGNTQSSGFSSCFEGPGEGKSWRASIRTSQWWEIEPDVGRVANGVDARVDRLKALGNGQVPLCAATAWNVLIERFKN